MANPAVIGDIESRWRPLSGDEATVAESLLADSWEMLVARVPDLQARLDDLSLSTGLVVAVVCAMVLRVMRNPGGLRQESIDDYTWIRDNAVSAGLLYLADDELALLGPAGDLSSAFSIRSFGEADSVTTLSIPSDATGWWFGW